MDLLMIKDVEKSYKKIKAVKGINFNVKQGELLGLLGPNGAGKSTTISMIATLLKPDKGQILYNGSDIVKNPKIIQGHLGYVPQEIALYPMLTGKENLQFWGRAYGLKGFDLKTRIDEVSNIIGINERLKDKVNVYSGGMKRRLNIGVALLHKPEIIIMDEPTVGIDPQSRNHILETVLKLNRQGMTVIYTSHYMNEVEYLCSRICIMDQGKIIASGGKQELIHQTDGVRTLKMKLEHSTEILVEKIESHSSVIAIDSIDDEVIVSVKQDKRVIKDIIDAINKEGATIVSMDIKEANLEAVFLQLTGRMLRD